MADRNSPPFREMPFDPSHFISLSWNRGQVAFCRIIVSHDSFCFPPQNGIQRVKRKTAKFSNWRVIFGSWTGCLPMHHLLCRHSWWSASKEKDVRPEMTFAGITRSSGSGSLKDLVRIQLSIASLKTFIDRSLFSFTILMLYHSKVCKQRTNKGHEAKLSGSDHMSPK